MLEAINSLYRIVNELKNKISTLESKYEELSLSKCNSSKPKFYSLENAQDRLKEEELRKRERLEDKLTHLHPHFVILSINTIKI